MTAPQLDMTKDQAILVLFVAFSITVPCFYFVLVALGFLPLAFILLSAFASTTAFIWHIPHCIVYGMLFYGLAALLAHGMFQVESPIARHGMLLAILAGLATMSLFPIYGASHTRIEWKNIFGIYARLGIWMRTV